MCVYVGVLMQRWVFYCICPWERERKKTPNKLFFINEILTTLLFHTNFFNALFSFGNPFEILDSNSPFNLFSVANFLKNIWKNKIWKTKKRRIVFLNCFEGFTMQCRSVYLESFPLPSIEFICQASSHDAYWEHILWPQRTSIIIESKG